MWVNVGESLDLHEIKFSQSSPEVSTLRHIQCHKQILVLTAHVKLFTLCRRSQGHEKFVLKCESPPWGGVFFLQLYSRAGEYESSNNTRDWHSVLNLLTQILMSEWYTYKLINLYTSEKVYIRFNLNYKFHYLNENSQEGKLASPLRRSAIRLWTILKVQSKTNLLWGSLCLVNNHDYGK